MTDAVAPEFVRFITNERRANRLPAAHGAIATGEVSRPVFVDYAQASDLLRVAATFRRPTGPALIIGAWGEALVAFAWQCVLGMVSGIAGAVGKDDRGNVPEFNRSSQHCG